jgi:Tfp pilus assembly protein PilN
MNKYQNIIHNVYQRAQKAGRAVWKFLSWSLDDSKLSFARVVCISIEGDGIHLVYGEKKFWRMVIKRYRHFPLEDKNPPSPEHLAGVCARFVSEGNISRASFILCLPRTLSIVLNIGLPAAAGENLSQVISSELDRFTPLTRDNACFDYLELGGDEQKINILLAVARADFIQNYQNALSAMKFHIQKVIISSFALSAMIRNLRPKGDTVFVALKEGTYECGVISNSLLYRSISGQVDPGDEKSVAGFTKKVQDLVEEFTAQGKWPEIVMDGEESVIQHLKNRFHAGKVSRMHGKMKLHLNQQDGKPSAIATGGVLCALGGGPDINLLRQAVHSRTRTPFLLTITLLLGIAAMVVFYFLAPLEYQQQKLDNMDRQIRMLKTSAKKVETLKKEAVAIENDVRAIDRFKKQNDPAMNILKEMTNLLPPKAWLTRLRITDKTVDIEGYAASATEIVLKLENSPYFQKVEYASPTFRDLRQNNERFAIKMELKRANAGKDPKAENKNDNKK